MASAAPPPVASTKETTNYARLCRLLVVVGSQVLRDTFDGIHPPAALHAVLMSYPVHATLQSLRKKKILNPTQWRKLYPTIPSSVSSASFDITLLMVLLRNICGLYTPITGWDSLPPPTYTSKEANIARVKYYRNTVYGHASQASVDNATFKTYWQDISNALVALGGSSYQAAIKKLKTKCMDPDTEEHYRELLKQWKEDEDSIKEILEGIEGVFYPTGIIDGIRQLYKQREGWLAPFPWSEEFHFHLDDIFTRLKVVTRKKTRGTATTDIVDMSGIFKPHEECSQPRTVLIEGKPGMGKTTYCKKLVYDWATEKQEAQDCFPRFELVLLLRCRDMKSDLWEAIDDQLLPQDVKESVRDRFFNFIRHNQSNVLLILDGLDEVPANKLPMFSEIIQGRVLPNCRLVVTGRHEAGIKVRMHRDTLLEIEGFTEENQRKFIVKYFKNMNYLAPKLFSQLKNDVNLKEMAANPLNTALLCLVCEELKGVFPEGRAELYLEIVKCVLRRYIQKKGLSQNNEDPIEAYKPQLKHLGWIALNGLCEDNLDFEESELGSHLADLPGFGFLSVHLGGSKLRPRRRYGFLHKSFQEWFAAFYLCCQLLDKEISADSLAADGRYLHELKEVLKFTCGMMAACCEETAEALVKSLTTQVNHEDDKECFSVVLECIRDCKKEKSDFHIQLARVSGTLLTLQTLTLTRITQADVIVLAGALSGNSSVTEMDLSKINTGDHGATSLAEALKENSSLRELVLCHNNIGVHGATGLAGSLKVNTSLTLLGLSHNNLGVNGTARLARALKENSSLTELYLAYNKIGDLGATVLAEVLKENSSLTLLDLFHNNMRAHGSTVLAEALKENTSLTWLDLSENNISDHGATSLAEALIENRSLTRLDLADNNISDYGATSLAETVKKSTSLKGLSLDYNKIGAHGSTSLAEALRENRNLRWLDLSGNNIGEHGTTGLAEALKENCSLKELYLPRNNIGEHGATRLAEVLKENRSLTWLDLSSNEVRDCCATVLADAVKTNTSLEGLLLNFNKIGDHGASGLAKALKENAVLKELSLDYSNIGEHGSAVLAEALKENTSLTWLYLSGNTIGDDGAISLAGALRENKSLKELYLVDNDIGDHGATGLAGALKNNSSLSELNLCFNNIGDHGATALAEALKENTNLTMLKLYHNRISEAILSELRLAHINRIDDCAAQFSEL